MDYFQKLNGFDEDVAMEFSMNLKKVNDEKRLTQVKGLDIVLNEDVVSILIGIQKGKKWDRDDRESIGRDKKTFFRLYKI